MVKIKRIYDGASADDGARILIDRLWPRGLTKDEAAIDDWLKEIAPSEALRKWFSHDPSKWIEFKSKYKKELEEKPEVIGQLRKHARHKTVTLLYAAKDTEHNNAVVLKEVLGKQ